MTTIKFDGNGKILPVDLHAISNEIKQVPLTKQKWDDDNIKQLPKLLALIFALWSLQKPEHLVRQQQNMTNLEEEEKGGEDLLGYLNQPHPAQILGILRCLGVGYNPNEKVQPKTTSLKGMLKKILFDTKEKIRNNFVQIKTGEGKSVTLAVLSIIFALCDFDVSCACYSQYLSQRDFSAFEAMFDMLGLKQQINYNTFNQICENEINKNGDLRDMVSNLILETPIKKFKPIVKEKQRPNVLLIDEVDVFFSDSFFG